MALPEEEELIEEVAYETQDSLTIGRMAKAEKPKEIELIKHAGSVLAFMTKELMPSWESKEERTVATEKKPFNYAEAKYRNHRRTDKELKTAKQEEKLWQIKNGYRIYEPREVVQSDGSREIIWPEEPLFASVARERKARQLNEAREKQDQKNEDLQRELNAYKGKLTNPALSQQNLDDIIRRYQELLIKPNTTPATKEKMPSGEEIWNPTLSPSEQSKQDAIIQSLQETLEELQAEGQQDRAKRILDDVIISKLNQTADVSDPDSYPDPKSDRDTIKVFRKVRDYKDPKDSKKDISVPHYYETEFVKRDTALKDKVQDVEKLLDESILNALDEDFSGNLSSAVAQLNSVADTLKARVLALADIRGLPLRELIGRALDDTKTSEERLAAIQTLMARMEADKAFHIKEDEKREILAFIEDYKKTLTDKQKECEKEGTQTLDQEKFETLLASVGHIGDYLSTSSTLSAPDRSFASQRLEKVKELLNLIEAKLDQALASGTLTEEEKRLCEEGKGFCKAGFQAATQAQESLDAASAAPEDLTSSIEIEKHQNQ
ncbi:MAG: hypothetical protein HYW85_05640 [Deltaproteobacteria bacterium]|nr:hypothetical protein [Deltaproteobacteria bacterium]